MRQQRTNESREQYLNSARRYARNQFNRLIETIDYRHCHQSHTVAEALRLTEKRFTDLGTFGVEGSTTQFDQDRIEIQYLNAGDSYEATICYYKNRFIVACWGDIAEKYLD